MSRITQRQGKNHTQTLTKLQEVPIERAGSLTISNPPLKNNGPTRHQHGPPARSISTIPDCPLRLSVPPRRRSKLKLGFSSKTYHKVYSKERDAFRVFLPKRPKPERRVVNRSRSPTLAPDKHRAITQKSPPRLDLVQGKLTTKNQELRSYLHPDTEEGVTP